MRSDWNRLRSDIIVPPKVRQLCRLWLLKVSVRRAVESDNHRLRRRELRMREIPLIEDHRLADRHLLAVPNAPALVPLRVADKHALDYVPLQLVALIPLDMRVSPAAPHPEVREVRLLAMPKLVRVAFRLRPRV